MNSPVDLIDHPPQARFRDYGPGVLIDAYYFTHGHAPSPPLTPKLPLLFLIKTGYHSPTAIELPGIKLPLSPADTGTFGGETPGAHIAPRHLSAETSIDE